MVRTVVELYAHDIFARKFHRISLDSRHVDYRVVEILESSRVVGVFVGDEYFSHLFRAITEGSQGLHIVAEFFAHIEWRTEFFRRSRHAVLEARIHENHFIAHVDEKVLKTAAVDDLFVEIFLAFLTAESKWLVHKTAVEHANRFNFHNVKFYWYLSK